jgi:hypothetical protein
MSPTEPRRSFRPGFLTLTIAAALLVTPGFALVADRFEDEAAYARDRAATFDDAMRDALFERGFAPWTGAPADTLRARVDVEFVVPLRPFAIDLGGGRLSGRAPRPDVAKATARIVVHELVRYPREFLDSIRLKRVIVCEGLKEDDRDIPSLPNYEHSLFLDVDAPEAFVRRLVHHETYHFADFADDGSLGRDPAWARVNDRWFVYGTGGRFMRDPGSATLATDLPGFLSRYATSALEEDKAETFAFAMTDAVAVRDIAAHDPVVANKLDLLRRQIGRFAPSMRGVF